MSDADVDADVEEEGDETLATVCLSSGSQCLFCSRRAASLPFPEKLGTGNTSQCPCCLQKLGRCVTYFFVPFMSVPQWCNWFGMDLAWQLCQQPAHTQRIGMHHAMTCFQFASRQWMPAISAHGSKYLKYLPAGCSPSFPTPGYLNYWSCFQVLLLGLLGLLGLLLGCWVVVVGPLLLGRCCCCCCCCCCCYVVPVPVPVVVVIIIVVY